MWSTFGHFRGLEKRYNSQERLSTLQRKQVHHNKAPNRRGNNSPGFTMIEIMIALSIVALLALLAIPSILPVRARTQIYESIDIANQLKPAVESVYKLKHQFPADNKESGLPSHDQLLGNFLTGITVEDGAMHLQLGNKIIDPLNGKLLSIRPIYVIDSPASPISWICGYSGVPDGMKASGVNKTDIKPIYLPIDCRPGIVSDRPEGKEES